MTPSARFFFVHVQKTAGTSLIKRIRHHFGDEAVYPNAEDGDPIARVVSVDHLRAQWASRGERIRVVTGHFPLCTAEVLGGGFRTLTVLREPVERTLSSLRHHRKLTAEDRDLPLEQIYEQPVRFALVHNHMVKMFSLSPEEMTEGALTQVEFTRDRLERAKQCLAGVDVVGLQERFEDFCDELSGRFGWDLGRPVTSNRTAHEDVSADFVERIIEDNADDIELYRFAQELVRERTMAGGRALD